MGGISGPRKILLAAVGAATITISLSPVGCNETSVSAPPDAGPVGNLVPPPVDASPGRDGSPVGNLIAPPPDGSTV